jgi:hypothetical protein
MMVETLTPSQLRKLEMIEATLKDLTKAISDLKDSYSFLIETQKELRDYVKSGYAEDFKEVLDFVRRIKVQQQPNVKVEEPTFDYPVYGLLFEKGILRGDIVKKKVKVDRRELIRSILDGKLSPVEKVVAIRALQRGIAYGGEQP